MKPTTTVALCVGLCVCSPAWAQLDPLLEVSWFAPVFSGGGYSSEAIAFSEAMDQAGGLMRVKLEQHGDSYSNEFLSGLPEGLRDRLVAALAVRHKGLGPSVAVCHSEPGAWHPAHYPTIRCPPADAQFKVGRTMFETDRTPVGWDRRMNEMDQIWVPTAFHRRVFAEGGVEPEKLRVLGEPVEVDFFDPQLHARLPLPGVTADTFVLLSVFKWEARKGWEVLLEAYWSEFRKDENVVLVILTNAYHSDSDFEEQAVEFMKKNGLGSSLHDAARVHFLPRLSQEDLASLYRAADVFVLPSRGEGWGRPHVEAMSMELPVIATNWSGPTEFMRSNNSYPLSIDGLTEIRSGAFEGHMWARPSVTHLKQLMRRVQRNPKEAMAKGQQARRDMIANYRPAIMGAKLTELLLELTAPRAKASKTSKKKGKKRKKRDAIKRTEIETTHTINVEL